MAAILCVDDDPDTCASLSDILSDLGYTVDTANDGPAALERFEPSRHRLALLDFKMPGMDGLELCRHLKATGRTVEVIGRRARPPSCIGEQPRSRAFGRNRAGALPSCRMVVFTPTR